MSTIVSFSETTSREIAALADAEGASTEQWINRYVIDIRRAVADRGGIDALEAANASYRDTTVPRGPASAASTVATTASP